MGYKRILIDGELVFQHRIIWKLVFGVEPKYIDHTDRDKSNNRLNNLRDVSHQENMRNRSRHKNNSSGETGVFWYSDRKKWGARLDGVHIGFFTDFDEAVAARRDARGKFTRVAA